MASAMARSVSPLHALALTGLSGVAEFTDTGASARISTRGAPDALARALGLVQVERVGRTAVRDDVAALRLGPDEWLVLAPPPNKEMLLEALRSGHASSVGCAVDVSDRHFGLILAGSRCDDVLASACPLDFGLAAFPAGMCTRTLFGKAEVILWRIDARTFRLEAGRSYAPYVTGLLAVCVRDLPQV